MGGNIQTTAIKIEKVKKQFGIGESAVTALTDITIDIFDNEFFTLLGPSGCGKTTLLRMIAGLESVTAGTIFLYGQEIKDLSANKRPINTVFQQYALFPHMTVLQNIGFGLKMLGKRKSEIIDRSEKMLELVQLGQFGDRRPSQLSGGQQQRVALARALAPSPKVLLLDEPLSALDLKLRQAMRVELKQIQEETGITFVFVTHDQEEALTMSDRIAVMSNGQLQQIGSAQEIYEQPRNQFVAGFIGETNLFDVIIEDIQEDQAICRIGDTSISCSVTGSAVKGSTRQISIRPERLSFASSPEGGHITGVVERLTYLGTDTQYLIQLDDGTMITVRSQNAHESVVNVRPGERIGLKLEKGGIRLLMN
ncbi:MAG: ABC transporter ATP-binding protein [Pseudomonadota bacterium]|nr:ABC transporter ATP-binding protein [Pseudomonadota bacterium]